MNQIAQTIIEQLNGLGTLRLLVAANSFTYTEDQLTFKFKGSRKVNTCTIKLMPSDTYLVTFSQFSPKLLEYKTVESFNDVYCEDLVKIFEETTGLYLSFSKRR